jgi:hypothetical protein
MFKRKAKRDIGEFACVFHAKSWWTFLIFNLDWRISPPGYLPERNARRGGVASGIGQAMLTVEDVFFLGQVKYGTGTAYP